MPITTRSLWQAASAIVCSAQFLGVAVGTVRAEDHVPTPAPAPMHHMPADPHANMGRYVGAGGCAAFGCHGGSIKGPLGTAGVKGAEYTIFWNHDPHRKAYATLYGERSETIVRNLYGASTEKGRAARDPICLGCHTLDSRDAHTVKGDALETMADGVSCEACHGPAEKWLAKHSEITFNGQYGFAARFEKNNQNQAEFGLVNTDNLVTRGRQCVSCHVGPRNGSDMNHDLIGAGHPRLFFEYSSYMTAYPAHWNREAEQAAQPFQQARLWAVGQVLTAEATIRLLDARSNPAGKLNDMTPPWAEFAEYDCYACHQAIRPQLGTLSEPTNRGAYRWGDALTTLLPLVASNPEDPLMPQLGEIRKTMELAVVRRDDITKLTSAIVGPNLQTGETALTKYIQTWNNDPHTQIPLTQPIVASWLDQVLRTSLDVKKMQSWEEAAQRFLAIRSLYWSMVHSAPVPVTSARQEFELALTQLHAHLKFPADSNSPREIDPLKTLEMFKRVHDAAMQAGLTQPLGGDKVAGRTLILSR